MNLSVRERKILWTKAGNCCSYHYRDEICDRKLVRDDAGKVSKDTVVGIECHIVGKEPGTARYVEEFPERESYSNAILLCGEHHKMVDGNENIYTVEVLKEMKKLHEKCIADKINRGQIVITDSDFYTEAKNTVEVVGMEVNEPARIQNVRSKLVAENVIKATGFSTNKGMTSRLMTCSHCKKPYPVVFTGPSAPEAICPHCGKENAVK